MTDISKILELVAAISKPEHQVSGKMSSPAHPYEIGTNYLIRTVTMTLTGELVSVFDSELVLVDAAWIADTGRYSQAIETCDFAEVEPYPILRHVIVNRSSVIDAVQIDTLPREQK